MYFPLSSFLLFFFAFIGSASATSTFPLIHTAPSNEEFLRKVVLINPNNGYESMDVPVEVSLCPIKSTQCSSRGSWLFKLPGGLAAPNATELGKLTGLNNFDPLNLNNEDITISTHNGNVVLASAGKTPSGGVTTFANHIKSFEEILNSRSAGIATSLANVVALRAKNKGIKNNIESEAQTSNPTQDLAAQKKQITDAFAFANYIHVSPAYVTITEVEQKNAASGVNENHYSVSILVPVVIQMQSYRFDTDSKMFHQYKDWTSDAGQLTPKSKIYATLPVNQSDIRDLFDSAYTAAYQAALLNLSRQLKNDEILSPPKEITEVRENFFTTRQNASDGLRVDSIWLLSRIIDGERQQVGLGKAAWVAPVSKEEEKSSSIFMNIRGSAAAGDQVNEIPISGIKVDFGGTLVGANLTSIGDSTSTLSSSVAKESLVGAKVGVAMDLGYLLNSGKFSDLWLTSNLMWAKGSSFQIGSINMNAPVLTSADIGIAQSFSMGSSGFAFSPALAIAYSQFTSNGTGAISANSYSLLFEEITLKPGISCEYTFNNDSDLSLGLEYPIQLRTGGTLTNQASSTTYNLSNSSFGQTLSVYLLYRRNLDRN